MILGPSFAGGRQPSAEGSLRAMVITGMRLRLDQVLRAATEMKTIRIGHVSALHDTHSEETKSLLMMDSCSSILTDSTNDIKSSDVSLI